MNIEDITFDNFMSLDHKLRKKIINDPSLLSIMVKKAIKEKRYLHSLSVAEVARDLAKFHHVDPKKAYIAGLLHDVTKYFSEQQHDEYLKFYDPEKLSYPESCKHSFSAKYFLISSLCFGC